jgi:hypothetical protein
MMTKAKAPTKSTKAPQEGHHRLDGTSPKLKHRRLLRESGVQLNRCTAE